MLVKDIFYSDKFEKQLNRLPKKNSKYCNKKSRNIY